MPSENGQFGQGCDRRGRRAVVEKQFPNSRVVFFGRRQGCQAIGAGLGEPEEGRPHQCQRYGLRQPAGRHYTGQRVE